MEETNTQSKKRWYVINTYSGFENNVKVNLENRIKASSLEDKFGKIFIPTEEVVEIKGGKRKTVSRKLYPGYILLEMEMDDEVWSMVRNTPNVSGFTGSKTKPVPLSESEIETMFGNIEGRKTKPRLAITFEKSETIKIIDGPFVGFTGIIEEINFEKAKMKVSVSILGRQTPVELDFTQVKRL